MAITPTEFAASPTNPAFNRQSELGDLKLILFTLDFSGNYATGGDEILTVFERWFGRTGYGEVAIVHVPAVVLGYTLEYVYSTGKVLIRQGDNDNAADAPGVELAAAAYPAALGDAAATYTRGFVLGR